MQKYLEATEIIDYHDPKVKALAKTLALDCTSDTQITKNCFEYVRDNIKHSGDYKAEVTTCKS